MISVYPENNRLYNRRNGLRSVKVSDSSINRKYCISCYKMVNLTTCNRCCKFFCSECLLPKYTSLYCYECADKISIFTCCFKK